jgi:hypothetical protein
MNFKVKLIDNDSPKRDDVIWEGTARQLLDDNDGDPDVKDALNKLKRPGQRERIDSYVGGSFDVIRVASAPTTVVGGADLREELIKLGSTNPELRPHIRPLLDTLYRRT